jgi:hypothetical protein
MSKKLFGPGILGLCVILGASACGQIPQSVPGMTPAERPSTDSYRVQQHYNVDPGTTMDPSPTRRPGLRRRGFFQRYYGRSVTPLEIPIEQAPVTVTYIRQGGKLYRVEYSVRNVYTGRIDPRYRTVTDMETGNRVHISPTSPGAQ